MNSKRRRLFINHNGISLAELVVSIGVLGFVMLALSSIMINNQKLAGSLEQHAGVSTLQAQIALFLNQSRNCEQNFVNLDPNIDYTLTQIWGRPTTGVPYLKYATTGPRSEIGGLRIVSMRVRAASPPMAEDQSGTVDVEVVVQRMRESAGLGTPSTSFRVSVMVTTAIDAPARIQNCSALQAEELRCKTERAVITGARGRSMCPEGFRVVGGGLSDGDISKNDHFNHPIEPTSTNPWGGWYCDTDDAGSTLYCTVICCR